MMVRGAGIDHVIVRSSTFFLVWLVVYDGAQGDLDDGSEGWAFTELCACDGSCLKLTGEMSTESSVKTAG